MKRIRDLVPWRGSETRPVLQGDLFSSLHREVNRLFDDYFKDFWPDRWGGYEGGAKTFNPLVDVEEDDREIVVSAELPGMTRDDISLSLRDDGLTISGEKHHHDKKETGGAAYFEASYGRFERFIPLNVEVEADMVSADMKNGKLKVVMPKSEKAQGSARKISIRTE